MKEKNRLLGIRFDCLEKQEAIERIFKHIHEGNTLFKIYTPNPEIVMKACDDPMYRDVLSRGDMVTIDGIGIVLASKIKGLSLDRRLTGVDLMGGILERAEKEEKRIFLLGGKPGVAESAAENIKKIYPNIKISGTKHGYFDKIEEAAIAENVDTDILFVALGAPKQEFFIDGYRDVVKSKVAMGVGGAFDVFAGTVRRAPRFFQKTGTEWLYRVVKDPARIGRLAAIPRFLIKVMFAKDWR